MDSENPDRITEAVSQFSFGSDDLIPVPVENTESARKFKILVVEDDPDIAQELLTTLARAGMDGRHATDGALALEALRIANFHLILLDLSLPGAKSSEICRQVRKNDTLPMIVMTAGEETAAQLKCFGLGADDYLIKPFSPQLLVIRVVSLLRRTYVYNKKKHPQPVPFSSLPISATVTNPPVEAFINTPLTASPLAARDSAIEDDMTQTSDNSLVLPAGWSRCDSCNYMGPTPRFTTQDGSGRAVMACPHCGDTSSIEYALG